MPQIGHAWFGYYKFAGAKVVIICELAKLFFFFLLRCPVSIDKNHAICVSLSLFYRYREIAEMMVVSLLVYDVEGIVSGR